MPETMPLEEPTVALPIALLTHVPPGVPILARADVVAWQKDNVPEIAVGSGSTVTTVALIQPVVAVYVMSVVPADAPVTTPDVTPIVATPVLELTHDTPVPQLRTVVLPTHTVVVPVMAPDAPLTAIGFILKQAAASV